MYRRRRFRTLLGASALLLGGVAALAGSPAIAAQASTVRANAPAVISHAVPAAEMAHHVRNGPDLSCSSPFNLQNKSLNWIYNHSGRLEAGASVTNYCWFAEVGHFQLVQNGSALCADVLSASDVGAVTCNDTVEGQLFQMNTKGWPSGTFGIEVESSKNCLNGPDVDPLGTHACGTSDNGEAWSQHAPA